MIEPPKIGDKIYVDTHLYLSHGVDDVVGGLATVSEVKRGISGGEPTYYVSVKEHPGDEYNWEFLSQDQEKLKEQFGDSVAYSDPDNRPEFNRWD